MTEPHHRGAATETALAYHRAWTGGDFEAAMTHVSPEIVYQAPSGSLVGADAFRGFMSPFARILTRCELVAAFGDDHTAVLFYETATVPVADAPGAEWLTVADGKITQMKIVFDRLPFDTARRNTA